VRIVVPALVAALIPLPAMAGEPSHAAKAKSLSTSLQAAAAKEVAVALRKDAGVARQAQQGSQPNLGSWSFFKSPVGAAVAAVLAVGVGYAVYSSKHDRIKAPGR
jgi:hypothetical protein